MNLKKISLFGKYHLRRVSFRCSRRYLTILLLSIICIILYASLPQDFNVISGADYRNEFYIKLFAAIKEAAPEGEFRMESVRNFEKCDIGDIAAYTREEKDVEKSTFENLNNCFHLNDEQRNVLTDKHDKFLQTIGKWKFSESEINKLFPNDRGIVTVGGSRFSVISLTMLESLRDRGTKLPVEVFIPLGDEGDSDYCNVVLPKLGAKCLYMRDLLPKEVIRDVQIVRYQNKVISILLSSFKEVIYIDADCLPLTSLDDIFEKSAYKKHGMILWPDLWRRVTAPVYYSIARIPVDLTKRVRFGADDLSPPSRYEPSLPSTESRLLTKVPFHDLKGTMQDPSSEAGQMIINKIQHLPSLLLSAYYNVHNTWYYKMLSQGTSGEGDKETFMAAAHALRLPYYQVKEGVKFDGFFDHEGFHGIALYQQDFEEDYLAYQRAATWTKLHESEISNYEQDYDVKKEFHQKLLRKPNGEELDSLFSHINYHKFEPIELAEKHVYINDKGEHFRGFTRKEVIGNFDLEMFNFKVLTKYLCGEHPVNFVFYKDKQDTPKWIEMCNYLKSHTKYLEDTHETRLSS